MKKLMKRRKAIVSLAFLAFFAFVAMVAISFFFEPVSIKLGSQFELVPIEVADYDINDIGVADVDQDGNLDIFTTNHSAQQSLLMGDGTGNFVEVLADVGLSQDRQFPRLENSGRSPKMDAPGFYIYRQDNLLHLVAKDTEAYGNASGSIELSAVVEFVGQSQAEVDVEQTELPSGIIASRIQFDISPGGHLDIKARESSSNKVVLEIPHQVQIADNLPLSAIFVGRDDVTPDAHSFDLMWRDRHSMSWSDVNDDGLLDVFVGRGGIHGKMRLFPEEFYDELFINQSDSFEDKVFQYQLIKDDCPGRQSAWVDFDSDGRLDIFNSCGRNASDGLERTHQLFQQQPDGTFEDIAPRVGLNLPRPGEFVWLDADSDHHPDVIAIQNRELSFYHNQDNTFTPEPIGNLADPRNKQFSVVDFDEDGSLDIYIAGKLKSYLLQKNEDNRYQMQDLREKGLPGYSLCANWVDYDNDGYSDLHVIPGGLYRQQPDHTFERIQVLSNEAAVVRERINRLIGWDRMRYQKARCSWFDYDNDGFRDLLMAQRRDSIFNRSVDRFKGEDPPSKKWEVRLFRNKGKNQLSDAHWLSVVLKGTPGNLEAIGASVSIETPAGTQTQIVGSSEGSYFSQGHYRMYFGLGSHEQATTVTVEWPDGRSQVLSNIAADQLLTIESIGSEASA
ncbi:FG-GAP repeat domain protein [Synechococcus sp. PCC 7335]|nr:FG-GAP repeat domain protein [Synechococcus sp. PCC 7335]